MPDPQVLLEGVASASRLAGMTVACGSVTGALEETVAVDEAGAKETIVPGRLSCVPDVDRLRG
jgi:hypothetical protein